MNPGDFRSREWIIEYTLASFSELISGSHPKRMIQEESRPTPFQIWLMAARPKTLPAAATPVIVGSAVAFSEGAFHFWPALAALLGALLLQIGANLSNDYFDFKKGADTHARQGPLRVTQAGLLTPRQVLAGTWAVFGLAALCGLYLALQAGWLVVIAGLLSIAAALAYTGGPFPLGYNGLGEVFVFIFFGLVAVVGADFVQSGQISPLALWAALPIGLLTVNILVVNNLRDVETDRASGKKTLAARFGAAWARREYLLVLVVVYLLPLLMWLDGAAPVWVLLAWTSAPLALPILRLVDHESGPRLNLALAKTGQFELVYGVLFSLGLLIATLFA